jgi:3-phosphoshikimate 1-carboxyvinyltransferase
MIIKIQKGEIFGKIKAPGSKSYTHRGLVLAALARGKSKIISPLSSDDTEATIDCLRKIGIKIKKRKDIWEVKGGKFLPPKSPLFCRESGTTLRLMTAVCALVKGKCILTGEKSLMKRPIKPLLEALKKLGVKCALKENSIIIENNFTPLEKNSLTGFIGGKTEIRGDISSQFISALLLVAPFAKKEVEIKLTTPLESKPYLLMTIEAQRKFWVKVNYAKDLRKFLVKKQNYKPTEYFVEGDWSSAAPFLAAGIIGGEVEVENLNLKSFQADREIIKVLKKMGGSVKVKRASILAEKSELKAIKFNIKDCPDLFPIICILAAVAKPGSRISTRFAALSRLRPVVKFGLPSASKCFASQNTCPNSTTGRRRDVEISLSGKGKSEISGVERLKLKESNRLEEMRQGLNKMGIMAYLKKERFFIEGGKPRGGVVDSKDHRIAMAFAVLGLAAEGKTIIKNAECVSKSFPEFFKVLNNLKK